MLIGRRGRWLSAALGHKLVELGLVLGEAKPLEERAELFLLLLHAAEGFGLVLVKGTVA